jgi:hypothetical protein
VDKVASGTGFSPSSLVFSNRHSTAAPHSKDELSYSASGNMSEFNSRQGQDFPLRYHVVS